MKCITDTFLLPPCLQIYPSFEAACMMNEWIDGWIDEWIDEWIDDGWMMDR